MTDKETSLEFVERMEDNAKLEMLPLQEETFRLIELAKTAVADKIKEGK